MGQSGDASEQQPPPAPEGDEAPMIQEELPSTSAETPAVDAANVVDASAVADEAAVEDAETEIVPQASLTPPSATPVNSPRSSGGPQPGQPVQPAQPQPQGRPTPGLAPASPPPGGGGAPWQGMRQVAAGLIGQQPQMPIGPVHAPWHTASSWGATTFTITAETAAGFSYLFWWVSGLLVYFNERENRFVRFHAVQSILLTGILSVFSVFAFTLAAVFNDLFATTHVNIWQTLTVATVFLALVLILFPWLAAMIAAWSGTYLQLPIIGDYAERFAAPPIHLHA